MQTPDIALRTAWAGVDTHKHTHMLGLKDELGRTIGTWEFPADAQGYAALADRIGDTSVIVGIEGARSYGAGLSAYLMERGYKVYEVIRPKREQRRRGKTDKLDALSAADNVAAGKCTPVKLLEGQVDELRWCMVEREQLIGYMTRLSNVVDCMLITAAQDLRQHFSKLSGERRMKQIKATHLKGGQVASLKRMAKRWFTARQQAAELEDEISTLVCGMFPALVGAPGIGAISAARLVLAAGSNPKRMYSEAAFSMLCGTSPIPASSGKTNRHRLNRGGDRQANRAIHEIARVRMAHDLRTKAYIEKKISQGKTKCEAIRCLCRFIAREVYHLLTGPQQMSCEQKELAQRRKALGISQTAAAKASGITLSKLGRLERIQEFDTKSLALYDAFLTNLEKEKKSS